MIDPLSYVEINAEGTEIYPSRQCPLDSEYRVDKNRVDKNRVDKIRVDASQPSHKSNIRCTRVVPSGSRRVPTPLSRSFGYYLWNLFLGCLALRIYFRVIEKIYNYRNLGTLLPTAPISRDRVIHSQMIAIILLSSFSVIFFWWVLAKYALEIGHGWCLDEHADAAKDVVPGLRLQLGRRARRGLRHCDVTRVWACL